MELFFKVEKDGVVTYEPVGTSEPIAVAGQLAELKAHYPYTLTFDSPRKIYGNGFGVTATVIVPTDGTYESRCAAFDEQLREFQNHLHRNKERLQVLLRANLQDVGDGSKWDPSGVSASPPAAVTPPPKNPLAQAAPPPASVIPAGQTAAGPKAGPPPAKLAPEPATQAQKAGPPAAKLGG